MARVTTHLGARRRNRLTTLLQRGPGSESAGYHYNAVPKHPAPTRTPTVAPPPSEAATSPAGDYAGASHEYHRAVAALPPAARTVTERAAVQASPLAPLASLLGPSATHSLFGSLTPSLAPGVPMPSVVPPALERKTLGSPSLEELLAAGRRTPLFSSEGPKFYKAAYQHNAPFAVQGPYQTSLSSSEEAEFQQWAKQNNLPVTKDYDLRGYWKAKEGKVPSGHFPDHWKTPYDTSFSRWSKYATPGNPFDWRGDNLVDTRASTPTRPLQQAAQQIWGVAAPRFGQSPDSAAPPLFRDKNLRPFEAKTVRRGFDGASRSGVLFGSAIAKAIESHKGKQLDNALLSLLHEDTHYLQFPDLSPSEREGGAEAKARQIAPSVYRALGIPFSPPAYDEYAGDVRRVLGQKGEDWVARGQLDPHQKQPLLSPDGGQVVFGPGGQGLRVTRSGQITTPRTRRSLSALRAAQARVDATGGVTTGLGPNADAFANALAGSTPLTPREAGAWTLAEGGAFENGGAAGPQNWLGIGYPGHPTPFGQSPYFSGSAAKAGRAAGQWMRGRIGGDYGYKAAAGIQQILPAAKSGGEQGFLSALGASGWGTDPSHVAQNLGAVKVSQPSAQDVQALRVAKQHARAVGINPTRFNGDVQRGPSPDTVFVRADAQGMVHWADSAVGTAEGSPKQLHWAAQTGLSSSQPWCADFISAGLSRRGVPLPPNPNYVPSYESEWSGGHNIGTDLSKAKPGDLIAFSGQHIGLYVGNGEMVSGNFGNEVARSPVSAGPAAVSAILRPNYKGGKVAVHESTPLPGSTAAGTFGSSGGAVGGAVPAAGGSGGVGLGQGAPVALTQLAPPLAAGPVLPGIPGQEDSGTSAEDLLALLESTPTALRSGRRSRRIG